MQRNEKEKEVINERKPGSENRKPGAGLSCDRLSLRMWEVL